MFQISHLLRIENKDNSEINNKIIVVVRGHLPPFALVVDEIYHHQQVVVKQLGDEARYRQGFMGSSTLGDGMPAVILDLLELAEDSFNNITESQYNSNMEGIA